MQTRPLRALIADANASTRADLAFALNVDPRIGEVISIMDCNDVVKTITERAVDVVFLDVRIPSADCFDTVRMLRRQPHTPPIVLVTDTDRYAAEAFDAKALDYLIRPINESRLRETLNRVSDAVGSRVRTTPTVQDENIPVELGGITRFIKRSEIRYVESHGDYARLVTGQGRHLIRVPLTVLEQKWAEAGFVRIHRKYLVSIGRVDEVRVDQGKATVMIGDAQLEVSRRHTRELRDRLVRHARPHL